MAIPQKDVRLIAASDVKTFFHEAVVSAIANQQLETCDETVAYVVNLLTDFTRADHLYEWTQDGYALKPLAILYGEAVEARTETDRQYALRRLGDVALFIAGLFAESLHRKPIDVGYYVSMGGTAYGFLSESLCMSKTVSMSCEVFSELSKNFSGFVNVLEEIGDSTHIADDADVVRWYEQWARTGSKRAARILKQHGIHIIEQHEGKPQH